MSVHLLLRHNACRRALQLRDFGHRFSPTQSTRGASNVNAKIGYFDAMAGA